MSRSVMTNDNDPRHGTVNGYSNLRCRCARCKAAQAVVVKERRARRRQEIDPKDIRHGTVSFYQNHGCRCTRCKEVKRIFYKGWREKP